MRFDGIFVRQNCGRPLHRIERLVRFFEHSDAARLRRYHAVSRAFGEISVTARGELMRLPFPFHLDATFQHVEEALRVRGAQFAAAFELSRVLRESRAQCWAHMHNRAAILHARQRGAHESVRREQQVIGLLGASRAAKVMQGAFSFEWRVKKRAARASASRRRSLSPHPRLVRFPPDRD